MQVWKHEEDSGQLRLAVERARLATAGGRVVRIESNAVQHTRCTRSLKPGPTFQGPRSKIKVEFPSSKEGQSPDRPSK